MARPKTSKQSENDWDLIFSDEKSRRSFSKWFWQNEPSRKNLVDALNKSDTRERGTPNGKLFVKLEAEYERTYIYGVLFKNKKVKYSDQEVMGDWRFVKIGKTEQPTEQATRNRMEIVKEDIEKVYDSDEKVAEVLFCLPLDPNDTSNSSTAEKNVRDSYGLPVAKSFAEKLRLPIKTEWVISTQVHIDKINKIKENIKKKGDLLYTSVITHNTFTGKDDALPHGLVKDNTNEVKLAKDDASFLFEETSFKPSKAVKGSKSKTTTSTK